MERKQYTRLSLRFKDRLQREIQRTLNEEVLEAGMIHPGEAILEKAISSNIDFARHAIEALVLNKTKPVFARDLLWMCASVAIPNSDSWKTHLIKNALRSTSENLREAAMRAIENWEGEMLIQILKSHTEPVEWVREYGKEILDDLSE